MVVGCAIAECDGILGMHAFFALAEDFINLVGVPAFDRR